MPKSLPGPSRLSQILQNLNKRNDHFGARHFLKEDLPRVRYANPKIDIRVNKLVKTKDETWPPELVLEFSDGRKQSLSLRNKWSSIIFQELMDTAGGNSWMRWKAERAQAGLPVVDGPPENYAPPLPRPTTGAAAVLP